MDLIWYIVSLVSCLLCCTGAALLICLFVGMTFLRKKGKKNVTPKEAVKAGAEQVSQMFIKPKKTREQLMAEEEEEERRGR